MAGSPYGLMDLLSFVNGGVNGYRQKQQQNLQDQMQRLALARQGRMDQSEIDYRNDQVSAHHDAIDARKAQDYQNQFKTLQTLWDNRNFRTPQEFTARARSVASQFGQDPDAAERDALAYIGQPVDDTQGAGGPAPPGAGPQTPALPSAPPPQVPTLPQPAGGPPAMPGTPPVSPLFTKPPMSPQGGPADALAFLNNPAGMQQPMAGRTPALPTAPTPAMPPPPSRFAPTGPPISPLAPMGGNDGFDVHADIIRRIQADQDAMAAAQPDQYGRTNKAAALRAQQAAQEYDRLTTQLREMNVGAVTGIGKFTDDIKAAEAGQLNPDSLIGEANMYRGLGIPAEVGTRRKNGGLAPGGLEAKLAATPRDQWDTTMLAGKPLSSYVDANGNIAQTADITLSPAAQSTINARNAQTDYRGALLHYLETTRTDLGKAQIDAIRQGRIPLDEATVQLIQQGRMPEALAQIRHLDASTTSIENGGGGTGSESELLRARGIMYRLTHSVTDPVTGDVTPPAVDASDPANLKGDPNAIQYYQDAASVAGHHAPGQGGTTNNPNFSPTSFIGQKANSDKQPACVDAVTRIAGAAGFTVPQTRNARAFEQALPSKGWKQVPISQAAPNDIITSAGSGPSGRHIQWYIGDNQVIEADSRASGYSNTITQGSVPTGDKSAKAWHFVGGPSASPNARSNGRNKTVRGKSPSGVQFSYTP